MRCKVNNKITPQKVHSMTPEEEDMKEEVDTEAKEEIEEHLAEEEDKQLAFDLDKVKETFMHVRTRFSIFDPPSLKGKEPQIPFIL